MISDSHLFNNVTSNSAGVVVGYEFGTPTWASFTDLMSFPVCWLEGFAVR